MCETEYCKKLHSEPYRQKFIELYGREPTPEELSKFIFDFQERIRREKNGDREVEKSGKCEHSDSMYESISPNKERCTRCGNVREKR